MNVTHGMDVAEVENLGRFLQQRADRLRQVIQEINRAVYAAHWEGGVAHEFAQQHWPAHRARLQAAADQLHGLGQSALNNATEQRGASGVGGSSGAGGVTAGGPLASGALWAGAASSWAVALGVALRQVGDETSLAGSFASVLGEAKNLPAASTAGRVVSRFGYFTDGYSIGEELGQGRYVDAGLDSGLLAGDLGADALKDTRTPLGYGSGVALQTWVEVGREARNVDWSSDGMRALQEANLGDWGSAFGQACTQMPLKLVKIFG